MSELVHGKRYTYVYYGCRCEFCTESNSAWKREFKDRLRPNHEPKHGTVNEYDAYRCRCEQCKAAKKTYNDEYYARNFAAAEIN